LVEVTLLQAKRQMVRENSVFPVGRMQLGKPISVHQNPEYYSGSLVMRALGGFGERGR